MIEDEKKHKASIETLKAYNYQLPESLIASYPHPERSKSRLLVYQMNKATGKAMILNKQFCDLPYFLKENDLLIYNDTRVSILALCFFSSSIISVFLVLMTFSNGFLYSGNIFVVSTFPAYFASII